MTDKLPKIGARYKLKNQKVSGNGEIVIVAEIGKDFSCKLYWEKMDYLSDEFISYAIFLNICDELPEFSNNDKEAISKMETTEKSEYRLPELDQVYRRLDKLGHWKCTELYIARSPDGPRFAYMELLNGCDTEKFNLRDGFWKYWEEIEPHKEEEKPKLTVADGKIRMDKPDYEFNLEESSAVDKALEELKEELKETRMNYQSPYNVRVKAENLINALEEEKEKKIDENRVKTNSTLDDLFSILRSEDDSTTGISEPTAECNHCGNRVSQGIWLERQGYCGISCQYDAKHKKSEEASKSIWKDATKAPIDGIHSILVKQSGHVYFGEVNGHYNNHPQIRLFFDGGFCDPEFFSEGDMEFCKLTDFINSFEQLEGRVGKIEKWAKSTGKRLDEIYN